MKLLSKMGFKGRLGAKEKGVSTVVETVVRPSNLGLGFGSFKEMAQLANNKVFEAQLRGEDVQDVRAPSSSSSGSGKSPRGPQSITDRLLKEQQSWKKSAAAAERLATAPKKARKEDKYVLSSSDLVQKASSQETLVVDMRGPDFNPSGADDSSSPPSSSPPEVLYGTELLHNLSHLISTAEMKIQTSTHYYNVAVAKEKDLVREERDVAANIERTEGREGAVRRIREAIGGLEDPGGGGGDDDGEIRTVLGTFQSIQKDHPDEWKALKLDRLVPTYLAPSLQKSLSGWKVFSTPTKAADLLTRYSSLCPPPVVLSLLSTVVLPLVQRSISSPATFSVVADCSSCVSLYESLKAAVGAPPLDGLLQTSILPRIAYEVEQIWDPERSPVPLHAWIFPWLPHLSLSHLFPSIRRKLHSALENWSGPLDASVIDLVRPWKGVFDDRSFAAMVGRDVVPKLAAALRSVEVNVEKQELEVFERVAEWREVSPFHGCCGGDGAGEGGTGADDVV